MNLEALAERLRELADWAEENILDVPINLPGDLRSAADALEESISPMSIDVLGLSTRAYSGLYRWGIRLVRDVAKMSENELLKIPGVGKGAALEIQEKVKEVYRW